MAVGSELLGSSKLDRNSLLIARVLAKYGIAVVEKRVVGDSVEHLAATLRELLERFDLVVTTGGLGPTADDVTREAIAAAVGRELTPDPDLADRLREGYAAQGRELPGMALKMARVVDGSRPLAPSGGAAPGVLLELRGKLLLAFPGVPHEMEGMLTGEVEPELASWNPGVVRVTRELVLGGVYESDVERRVAHLYDRFGRENVSILASKGVVRLVLTAAGEARAARAHVDRMERAFGELLGEDLAGVDVAGLAGPVLAALRARGETLVTAESCTGGLVAARLTEVPGSSDVLLGGAVTYSNALKEQLVDVPHDVLLAHGAVSEPVARAMAEGARRRLGADWSVALTGIAGPGGGTADKPVGLVHWAVAGPTGTVARHQVFRGPRSVVRAWSVNWSLDLLRRAVAAAPR